MPHKRYVVKEGTWIDESLAELLGIEGDVVEQWIDDGDLASSVLSLSPEQAREIRDAVPD